MYLKFYILAIVYLYFLSSSSVVLSERVKTKLICPAMCNCYIDEYSKLKKVECDGRKLINPNIEAPIKTEYLDLSNNMITTLDKGSFEGLFYLIKIHMYSNAIDTVYSDTFLRLRKLTYVDLSDNRIEEIDEGLFETNNLLKTVILSYNKFSNLANRPFLISDSLEILNLKKCQISHVYSETFKRLPKLQALDLSANLLASVSAVHMKPLKALNWLDLNGNPWKCDKSIEMVRQWAKSNDIMIFLVECAPKNSEMFEKIILAPDDKPTSELIESDDDSGINEDWLIDNEDNNPKSRDYEDPKHIHEMLTECQERLMILSKENKILTTESRQSFTKSIIFFLLGIIIGVLLSTTFFFIIASRKAKRKWAQREYARESCIVGDEIDEAGNIQIISNQIDESQSSQRQREHHRRRQPRRPKKSFLASLFERRRVYRHLHPPTLIRRLSRSNLFSSTFGLNRSESRPRLDRQCSRRQNMSQIQTARNDIEQRRLLTNTEPGVQNPGPSTQRDHPRRCPNQQNTTVMTESNVAIAPVAVIHAKPETPPPTYTDCMITFES